VAGPKTRVVVVRGHQATPWELRSWELLPERFDVSYLLTGSNSYELGEVDLDSVRVRTLRGFLPRGRLGDLAAHAVGDRYLRLRGHLRGADIVHAEELSYWFAAEAAKHKQACGYKLALTVWETLPLRETFRNPGARRRRELVLEHADLYLPATERARHALLLEGVAEEQIIVSPPGIDVERLRARPAASIREHVLLSVGRLVWEKGHQDVIRALAAIRAGLVGAPTASSRLRIVGSGPERRRLEAYANELGLADSVEILASSYDEMPGLYAQASCLVLPSLPAAGCFLGPTGVPRCFWEEQFGMVLAEAMAAGLPIVASASGAIPEVVGYGAVLVPSGDWLGLARALADTVFSREPSSRVEYDVRRFSREAAAGRLAAAYDRLTAAP
jgi:glycosyltransferase involved in cell wall biosynthesis